MRTTGSAPGATARARRVADLPWDRLRPTAVSVIGLPYTVVATTGILCLAIALVTALASAAPLPAEARPDGLRALAVAVALVASASLRWGRRPRAAWVHALVGLGSLAAALAVALAGGGTESVGLAGLVVLVVVDVFLFFPWWIATVHLVLALAGCTLALHAVHADGAGQPLLLAATTVAVGLSVGWHVRAAAVATRDPLTGLSNRQGLDHKLACCLERVRRTPAPLTLALIDIDGFSAVNELAGRAAGDRVLRETALGWSRLLPASATLARLGGDEFAVVLPGHDVERAAEVVDQLRAALPVERTCSAGVAAWESGDTASLLLNRADALLYQSKRGGRSRTTTDARSGPAVSELQRAFDIGQIFPVYQPIVELRTGRLSGVEALARWQDPERGWIPPVEFIPVAEESGLIIPIGLYMLDQACGHAARWVADGVLDKVTVNVSGRELVEPGYVQRVDEVLRRARLAPEHLVLEITETTLDADTADVALTLELLRERGIRIAMDDFGTGFSTLSRLNRLPVDILKVDQSFVSDIRPDDPEAPLVAAVVALGHALGLTVVAEGVEEEYQRELLTGLGCEEGQGYLFGVATTSDRIPAFAPRIPRPRAAHAASAPRPGGDPPGEA